MPGVTVADVARRHGTTRWQVYDWRRRARDGRLVLSAEPVDGRWMMAREPGLFDIDARLRELSAKGDDLERVNALVDFEAFRRELEQAVPRADRSKGGRPPYDHVLMFRILILQASHSLSDERTEYLIKDRLSFMRFLGLSLADRVPCRRTVH